MKSLYFSKHYCAWQKGLALVALALIGFALPLTAQAKGPNANDPAALKLVQGYETKTNLLGLDVTSTFTLVQKKPGEADRVLQIKIYRRDAADTFTLVFKFPNSEKGKGYYRKKDDLFLYLPSTREFVYRNRKDDVGSTDVRTDLFGKSDLAAQYWISSAGTAKVASWDCDVVRLDAKQLDVSFPVQKWFFRKSDGLAVKVENFSAAQTLLRTAYYLDYKNLGNGRSIFTKLLSVDALEKGQQTLLSNEDVSSTRIDDYTFSKAFLEEESR